MFLSAVIWFAFGMEAQAKEVALTFDDVPGHDTAHFNSKDRTRLLIKKLKDLNLPPAMFFSNPCFRPDTADVTAQLKLYRDAGHFIANHTCSHPRLDDVGADKFIQDIQTGDRHLAPLFNGQKFLRYPFLNEGTDLGVRDRVRAWLSANDYRNGFVSLDNDDYAASERINVAKKLNKPIDYKKVEELLVKHVVSAAEFYDRLAVKTLGRSPKHVILLHERDATVMYLEALIFELRQHGWKIISAEEAFKDPIYLSRSKNTYSNNGLVAQLAFDRTGVKEKKNFYNWKQMYKDLSDLLNIPAEE
jgi:peptidoglycan-N-acetylglucosamine deacetylase